MSEYVQSEKIDGRTRRWEPYRKLPLTAHKPRFMTRVDINPLHPDGCWEWTGERNEYGYGLFTFRSKPVTAHRASYIMFVGEIALGLHVLHRCDNPPCVAPHHLWLGTPALNLADCIAKGRHVATPGERNGRAKLTAAQVCEIRELYANNGGSTTIIGARFGVSSTHVSRLVRREMWKHI